MEDSGKEECETRAQPIRMATLGPLQKLVGIVANCWFEPLNDIGAREECREARRR